MTFPVRTEPIRHVLRLAILALAFGGTAAAQEGESMYDSFLIDYALVQYSLMNEAGATDELNELSQADQKAADFIADFWTAKANRSCMEEIYYLANRDLRALADAKSDRDEARIMDRGSREARQCRRGYYFDHWDKTTLTIRQRYERAAVRTKK